MNFIFIERESYKYEYVHDRGYECDAFPDGIPKPILAGELDHYEPNSEYDGIQFSKNSNFRDDLVFKRSKCNVH